MSERDIDEIKTDLIEYVGVPEKGHVSGYVVASFTVGGALIAGSGYLPIFQSSAIVAGLMFLGISIAGHLIEKTR